MSTEPDVMGYAVSGKRQPLPSRAVQHVWTALRRVWAQFSGEPEPGEPDLYLVVWFDGMEAARCRVGDLRLMREVASFARVIDPASGHVCSPSIVVVVEEAPAGKVCW